MSSFPYRYAAEFISTIGIRKYPYMDIRATMWYHPATKEKHLADNKDRKCPPFSFSGNYSTPVETSTDCLAQGPAKPAMKLQSPI